MSISREDIKFVWTTVYNNKRTKYISKDIDDRGGTSVFSNLRNTCGRRIRVIELVR